MEDIDKFFKIIEEIALSNPKVMIKLREKIEEYKLKKEKEGEENGTCN